MPDNVNQTAAFKAAEGLKKHNLDISSLVNIEKDLSDSAFLDVLNKSDFETLDKNILEKFMPFLDDVSKNNLFEKIIDGELDYHFLEIYLPFVDVFYVATQIEAAIIEGTIDWDALHILRKASAERMEKLRKELKEAGDPRFQ